MSDSLQVDVGAADLVVEAAQPDLIVSPTGGDMRVDVLADAPLSVEFAAIGLPGRDGVDGARVVLDWSPPSASASWLIAHNLGRYPFVQVVLPDGEAVGCQVRHLDLNLIAIDFAAATSGTAHLA